ncbi:non-ribosomal peptide synthetase [Lacrimispora algidixylanolytica]|uniref:Carrier domain-containing protein n=1 Tax=Lacrimispora algidixylanolytica TaxID=94868 RepID=A0A419T1L6_9FIRM|nr:non-ribosomal peptide synthetase [Lacrimispora algidixylanolytica]RKD31346.1 hypothetical protein BET01_20735 [Lacrimispora algidixylanolytica]
MSLLKSIEKQANLYSIFEEVVSQNRDGIAVSIGDEEVTYGNLEVRVSNFASTLIKTGIQKGELVCLCVEKSVDMIIAILAIIRVGAVYVPIDYNYPKDRCRKIIEKSRAKYIIVNNKNMFEMNCKIIEITKNTQNTYYDYVPAVMTTSSDLAYIIFTSGSTGEPKGVMIEQGSVIRLFEETKKVFNFNSNDVWTNFHSVAFDFSVWEIWGALLFGGHLVLVPDSIAKDPDTFYQLIYDKKVTVLNQTPTSFRNLIPSALANKLLLTELRYIIFGGERLDYQTLKPWTNLYGITKPKLINMYGITETTVHVTWKLIDYEDINNNGYSLIGRPIDDMKICIVKNGEVVPMGEEGVMFIAGPGVARGYLYREDLTYERFIQIQGSKLTWFDSGDLGIQIDEDEYAYVGRADRQLKVRGYRIEPNEIEECIRTVPYVQDCIVLSKDYGEGDIRLVSYIVASKENSAKLIVDEVKQCVSKGLPNYMQPSTYFIVDKIPTTINNKLDIDILNKIDVVPSSNNTIVEKLKLFWEDILEIENIEENTDFMSLGGTSFSLIRMLRTVNKQFGINVNLNIPLNEMTIRTLAEIISNSIK